MGKQITVKAKQKMFDSYEQGDTITSIARNHNVSVGSVHGVISSPRALDADRPGQIPSQVTLNPIDERQQQHVPFDRFPGQSRLDSPPSGYQFGVYGDNGSQNQNTFYPPTYNRGIPLPPRNNNGPPPMSNIELLLKGNEIIDRINRKNDAEEEAEIEKHRAEERMSRGGGDKKSGRANLPHPIEDVGRRRDKVAEQLEEEAELAHRVNMASIDAEHRERMKANDKGIAEAYDRLSAVGLEREKYERERDDPIANSALNGALFLLQSYITGINNQRIFHRVKLIDDLSPK